METIKISEQEIINALCIYTADKRQVTPQEVEVELMYDDEYGFSAEVEVGGRTQILIKLNYIEAIRVWLNSEYNIDPFAARIELQLDDEEGIIAIAKV